MFTGIGTIRIYLCLSVAKAVVFFAVCWSRDAHVAMTSQIVRPVRRPNKILGALSLFFAAGTVPSLASAVAILFPGEWSEAMWRLKPEAQQDFARMGGWAAPLMILVAVACASAAVGLWIRRRWGYRIAVGLLSVNLVGDVLNGLVRGDWRTLIGVPIGGAMLAYLLRRPVRAEFIAGRQGQD